MRVATLLLCSALWGALCFGISLGLHAVGGTAAQLIFLPFALFGGIGIGVIAIRRMT